MSGGSALYAGGVTHRRLRPVPHLLRYRVFWLLIDLDELPQLSRRLRLFSLDRLNVFSLHARDYGDGQGLRAHVERQLRAAGLEAGGPIHLLTMPRMLGHVFNPLNVYFCHGAQGVLQAVLYEVNNTFGERHGYLVEVNEKDAAGGRIVQQCAKGFHVSPFLDLDLRYRFDVEPPSPDRPGLRIAIAASDAEGPVLVANMEAARRPLTDRALARAFLAFPLLTLKVIAAIHWEALLLWIKGIQVRSRPRAPAAEVTIIRNEES